MANNISKQDRQGARTPADLERKYKFGGSFAEAAGFAEDARRAAEQAEQAASQVSEVFAKDIVFTGTLTNEVEAYLLPGEPEIVKMEDHYAGLVEIPQEQIPLYDFNNDGEITLQDIQIAGWYRSGEADFSAWSGAVKSTVTMTIDLSHPDKAIRFNGINMWGRAVESYLGIDFTTAINRDMDFKLGGLETRIAALEGWVALFTQGG